MIIIFCLSSVGPQRLPSVHMQPRALQAICSAHHFDRTSQKANVSPTASPVPPLFRDPPPFLPSSPPRGPPGPGRRDRSCLAQTTIRQSHWRASVMFSRPNTYDLQTMAAIFEVHRDKVTTWQRARNCLLDGCPFPLRPQCPLVAR